MSRANAMRYLLGGLLMLGALGGFQAVARSDAPPRTGPASPCVCATGSFHFRRIETGALERADLRATFIDTRPAGRPPHCPPSVRIGACVDASGPVIADYVCYLGPMDFGYRRSAASTANEASQAISDRWKRIASAVDGDDGVPVRVMVVHYPYEDAPGHCITVQTTFSNAPDAARDRHLFQGMRSEDATFAGVLVRIRKTYQLQGSGPRLVEASVEAFDDVDIRPHSLDYAGLLGVSVPEDTLRDSHYEWLGRRKRWGLVWMDRSWGLGEPRPWSGAYHASRGGPDEAFRSDVAAIPVDWQVALRALVERL